MISRNLAESITFTLSIGLVRWQIILGLIIGEAIATPFAALACKRVLMVFVGVLIILLSVRTIYLSLVQTATDLDTAYAATATGVVQQAGRGQSLIGERLCPRMDYSCLPPRRLARRDE